MGTRQSSLFEINLPAHERYLSSLPIAGQSLKPLAAPFKKPDHCIRCHEDDISAADRSKVELELALQQVPATGVDLAFYAPTLTPQWRVQALDPEVELGVRVEGNGDKRRDPPTRSVDGSPVHSEGRRAQGHLESGGELRAAIDAYLPLDLHLPAFC